jgi:hypothetical protein
MTPFLVFLLLASVAAVDLYTPTPVGHILSHCIHQVKSGSSVSEMPDGQTKVVNPNGTVYLIPVCDTQNGTLPMILPKEKITQQIGGLPADYDGWLQYTALNVSKLGLTGGFDAFTSFMSVPDKPQQPAQVLYFFPGLQNIDWIPKVDPEPSFFDIIQPVLQYPAGFFDNNWAVRSWYVTVNAGALQSDAISVQPGDSIFCNMTRTGEQAWDIVATVKDSPSKTTSMSANNARLKVQPWAYAAVLECYGCDGCSTYPTEPINFSENKLYQEGRLIDVPGSAWALNPKPAEKEMCPENTIGAMDGDTTISFA